MFYPYEMSDTVRDIQDKKGALDQDLTTLDDKR